MSAPEEQRIELLGGLRIRRGGEIITRFRTHKTGALLGFLAYHAGKEHLRDEVVELLWPEDDRDAGRHKLSVALSALRVQLEPDVSHEGAVLRTGRQTVELSTTGLRTDVSDFEAALNAAHLNGAYPDPDQRNYLAAALELFRGRLLPGYYEEWIAAEQRRLVERYQAALGTLVGALEREGGGFEALRLCRRALQLDPLSEETHSLIIRLHLKGGRQAEALRQYQELERLLRRELDTEPSNCLRALVAEARSRPFPELPASVVRRREETTGDPALESVRGAVPLNSPFYVERPVDEEFTSALERADSIVLLKGAAQTGKSSLLARGLQRAREAGARVVGTDLQMLNTERLASPETLLLTLAEALADQLDLPTLPREAWGTLGGPNLVFRRYLRREVLGRIEEPVVWGLDGVDRVFQCPFGSDIFELFRSWHNERAFDPGGPWSRFTVAIAYATEAHLFITDPNRSPFNVGTRLLLEDFTPQQVEDLNRRHGAGLRTGEDLKRFYGLVGGHPYLVRSGLREISEKKYLLADFTEAAGREDGPFGDHLRHLWNLLARDEELCAGLREILRGTAGPRGHVFYRLRSAGVLSGETAQKARLRCRLYADYLARQLL